MIVIHVSVKVHNDKIGVFETNLKVIVNLAKKHEGCLKYEYYYVPSKKNEFVIYGEFNSEDEFKSYLSSQIVTKINSTLIPNLLEKPKFSHYKAELFQ